MRKFAAILIFSMGLVLNGCGSTDNVQMPVNQDENSSEIEMSGIQAENLSVTDIYGNQSENASEGENSEIKTENIASTDVVQGGAYVYNDDSWMDEIKLDFSLKNISSTGATLVFSQHDPDAPKGELMYGEDYVIEVKRNGEWEEAPIVVEGNYGFDAIAILIKSGDTVERELDWEWLYGELEPGEYRIRKEVHDFIETGNFDEYMVYAYFILN